VYVSITFSKTG